VEFFPENGAALQLRKVRRSVVNYPLAPLVPRDILTDNLERR
jgi:hypothetical protein